jgi:LSD1 subclass zinc finger protein
VRPSTRRVGIFLIARRPAIYYNTYAVTDYEPTELRCKSCGAGLRFTAGATSITCPHCGTEYIIELSTDEPPAMAYDAELLELLRQGRSLQAIKHLRSRTGLGLKEAKNYVGELARRENMAVSAGASQAGWVVVAAAVGVFLIGALVALLLALNG